MKATGLQRPNFSSDTTSLLPHFHGQNQVVKRVKIKGKRKEVYLPIQKVANNLQVSLIHQSQESENALKS